jgi:16S rRNA processing protein RimM
MPAWEDMVLVGRVTRAHGLRGHVVVSPETDFVAERFHNGAELWARVDGRQLPLVVADARVEGRRPIVAFQGCMSVEAAEALSGAELRVPESDLQPLPEGSYYLHQLVGCRVETVEGAPVGTVTRVEGGAGAAVLAIDGATGEVLVPLAQEICVGIDVGARLIRVRMLEGLLELNQTRSEKRSKEVSSGASRRRGSKPRRLVP